MAAHRYWRVYITENTGSANYLDLREVEFRETIGGADATGSGTAYASSYTSPYIPANAFDNSASTLWHITNFSGITYPQWLAYDFGAGNGKDILEFGLTANDRSQTPASFQLQYSDDNSVWTTTLTIGPTVEWTNGVLRVFNADNYDTQNGDHTAWQIHFTANNGATEIALSQVGMFLAGSATSDCSGGSPFANSVSSLGGTANFPASAFDGVPSSQWLGNYQDYDNRLGYRFSSGKSIVTVGLTAPTGGTGVSQAPKNFTIEYWNGSSWQTYATLTNITGWSLGQTRYFNSGGEISAPVAGSAWPTVFVTT